jgi:ATP synthase F0 subunit b
MLLAGLCFAGPAFAADPAGGPTDHAAQVDHADDHGDAHHVDYLADDDGDGTANWLDSDSEGYAVMALVQHTLNLFMLLGLMFYFGRAPIRDALHRRASNLRHGITEAARAKDEAQQRYDAVTARLDSFAAEVATLKATAAKDAKAEEERLIARAQEEAARISDSANKTIKSELNRARATLRDDAVHLAVELAEKTLRSQVQAADQKQLARQFLDALQHDGANHG